MIEYFREVFTKNNMETIDLFQQKQRHYGPANKDKIIYYIEEDNQNLGFFAMYRYWLEYLYFADICGYTPVVYAGDHFTYRANKAINNILNPFEYYFLQPASITVKEVKTSNRVIISDVVHRKMVELIFTGKANNYKYNKRYLHMMAYIVQKYMQFNSDTKTYIEESIRELNSNSEKMLGVHIRGTDFRAQYNNHPVYVTENDCYAEIDYIFENDLYDKIFLATDDVRILTNFVKRYGKRVCFYEDVERSSNNKSVAFSKGNRSNHKYLLGLEVIRDMYTLSICNGLVAGISQVAICAQINKLSRGEKYKDIRIIDKGLYRNGHNFVKK